jgi:hypothetical protein
LHVSLQLKFKYALKDGLNVMNVQFSRRQEHDVEAAYLTKESFVIDVRRMEVNEGGSLFGDLIK